MNNLSKKSNRIFQAGIIGVAIGSALCCLLPLLAVASGVSALAAAGTLFENLRWPLIVVAGLLLVVYGYRQFFAKGCECSVSEMKTKKIGFSILTILFMAFAVFPDLPFASSPLASQSTKLKIEINGMTCHGCAASVQKAIENISGVEAVSVDFNTKTAMISPDTPQIKSAAIKAIQTLGYSIKEGKNYE